MFFENCTAKVKYQGSKVIYCKFTRDVSLFKVLHHDRGFSEASRARRAVFRHRRRILYTSRMPGSRSNEAMRRLWKSGIGQVIKGVRWMPWCQRAKKGVASYEKPRGAASRLRSVDTRMGKPTVGHAAVPIPE
jgi:hypothetical protein